MWWTSYKPLSPVQWMLLLVSLIYVAFGVAVSDFPLVLWRRFPDHSWDRRSRCRSQGCDPSAAYIHFSCHFHYRYHYWNESITLPEKSRQWPLWCPGASYNTATWRSIYYFSSEFLLTLSLEVSPLTINHPRLQSLAPTTRSLILLCFIYYLLLLTIYYSRWKKS